jgi:hypothetical protein
MDTAPIVSLFNQLMTAGLAVGAVVCAFFLMLAGYQWMTAGGSVRAVESAKGSLTHALIGLAIVALCKVLANLVAAALGAPQAS